MAIQRSLKLSLCFLVLSVGFLPAMSLRLRSDTSMEVLRSNTQQDSTHNTQTFPTVIEAAQHFAGPFINNVDASTADVYTYDVGTQAILKTNYGQTDPVWGNGGPMVGWDINQGKHTASVDCSGFVTRVLGNTVPAGSSKSVLSQIVTQPDGTLKNYKTAQHPQPFPSAADYASMIISNTVFKAVSYSQLVNGQVQSFGDFGDTQPGDVLAYGLSGNTTDTGHVMIIENVQLLQHGQLNTDYWATDLTEFNDSSLKFYAVKVFDSSTYLHYKGVRGQSGNKTGVGHGTVLVIANSAGSPIGFLLDSTFKVLSLANVSYTGKNSQGALGTLAAGRIN